MDVKKAELVLAGDGCVGKTSMFMSYPNKTRLPGHPWEVGQVSSMGAPLELELWDIPSQGRKTTLACTRCGLSDLRQDSTSLEQLKERDQSPVSAEEAEAKALEIGAVKYVGCSTNTGHNLKGTFDEAVNAILNCSHAQAQDMSMAHKPKCRASKPLSVTDASAAVRSRGRGCVRSSGRPFFVRTAGLWRGLFTSAESHGEQYRQPEEEDAIFEDREGGFSDAIRTQVLDAALAQVAKYGWTVEALSLAAAEQGLSNLAHGLFRRGPVELVEHFIAKCNARMLEELSALDMEHMTLKEKIRAAIHARLRQYAPHIATWPQAIAILAQPSNASTSFSLMFNTINDIIYVAGDSTVDFDWYTKRAVLAGVYTSTELFMLTDASDNFADTWAFLDRRLEDVVTLSKYKAECETLTSLALGYLNAVVQKQHAPTGESPFHHSPPPHGTPPPPPPAGPAGPFTPSPHDDSIPPRA